MSETNATPEKHSSLVGGSTAARRMKCHASWAFEQQMPKGGNSSVYAQEGTALHEMMAVILGDPNLDVYDIVPFEFSRDDRTDEETGEVLEDGWDYTITEAIWEQHGQPALDAFLDYMDEIEDETGGVFEYILEKSCELPGIDGAFGTSDIVWKCGELSGVWDWKFGFKKVFAGDNDQLMFYARAAASTHPSMFGAKSFAEIDPERWVALSIMQPQCGDKPDTWRTTVGHLEDWRVNLKAAIEAGQADGVNAKIEKGKHCDFAPCKAICPLWLGQTQRLAEKIAAVQDRVEESNEPLRADEEFVEALPSLLELAEIAQEWAAEIFGQAKAVLEDGGQVHGWKLKDKASAGREFIISKDEVIKLARNRKITLDEVAPRKLLSAPQFETLLKKKGKLKKDEKLSDKWARSKPSSGASLTRSDDPAPAYETNTARVSALAAKLAHLNVRDEETPE